MQTQKKKLPIGMENFGDVRTEDFYYVDKTGMIAELLYNWGAVNLFTRPRRFGKSLNISMLEHFFSLQTEKSIFNGLEISGCFDFIKRNRCANLPDGASNGS